MLRHRFSPWILLVLFALFMAYPLSYVVLGAFFVRGDFTLAFFSSMLRAENNRVALYNSLNLALCVTTLCSVLAYALALLLGRFRIPFAQALHSLILAPLVVPPFVGVLGIRQLLGRFGSVNILLLDKGLIVTPIDWLGAGGAIGLVVLQVIHLTPILYMSIRASLQNAHISLEEAAVMCGASRAQVLRKVVIPLSLPGWLAGATIVFIASFTDLGTPLLLEFRNLVSVQIFNMLSDLHENPVGYSFVVSMCTLAIVLFALSKASLLQGGFAGSGRGKELHVAHELTPSLRLLTLALILLYALTACVPQAMVVLVACSKDWFMSFLPQQWTLQHFARVLHHPITTRSIIISTCLSLAASFLTVVIGFYTAHIISRGSRVMGSLFEALSLVPLAVPGIVFAFGFIGAFSGTPLDNRLNPFPLLIIAYTIRRVPGLVRSVCAALQESSKALEEAACMVGASPFTIVRRITFPLVRRHVIVGAMLAFSYSMIEVSDSLLLALEARFYPIAKAIYFLTAHPDGFEVASALGVIVMILMLGTFYLAERLSQRRVHFARARKTVACFLATICVFHAAPAYGNDELTIVSPHWEGIRTEFGRGFSKSWRERTGREVVIRWLDVGGTSDIVKYVRAQFKQSPDTIGIDLVFGGGSDTFIEFERMGVLAPAQISPSVLNRIPPSLGGVPLYSERRTWFANALSAFGILYNKPALERLKLPTPQAWSDLADARYFGAVGAGDPRKSGSMHAMYEIILQGYGWNNGWQLLQRIGRNVRQFSGGASQIGKEVAIGEVLYGIAIDTYAGDVIRQVGHERLGYVLPNDFAALNGDAIGMLKGAPHAGVAQAFIEFAVSEHGQRLWYAKRGTPGGPEQFELGKLTILPELYGTVEPASVIHNNPFAMTNILPYDAVKASKRWALVNDLFGVFIIDAHKKTTRPGAEEFLVGIPVSEEQVGMLERDIPWGDNPALRAESLRVWSLQADELVRVAPALSQQLIWVPGAIFLALLLIFILRRALFSLRST